MNQIKLKGLEAEVGRAALGTALFGTVLPEEECRAVLDEFFECGGNIVDTALIYADWEPGEKSSSEKVIGRWIKDKKNRHSMVISTKGGHPKLDTMNISRLSEKEIFEDIDSSLKNLQTDYIDIYFLHRDDKSKPVGEIMETLNKLVRAGKARNVGLSNWSPLRIAEARKYCRENNLADIFYSQIEFGIAEPNPGTFDPTTEFMDSDAYEFYRRNDINLFSCSAQSGGYFFNLDEHGLPKANKKYDSADNLARFDEVMRLCRKYDCSAAGILVAALCSNPHFRTIPILGCMSTEQLKTSVKGTELNLKEDEVCRLLKRTAAS